ncbi:hypothetical protein FHW69_000812 [Luteibacter sp. Sphag1AF]|nr:hypothetical protein [Luteibacter sp. Sphag1AF]
MKVWGRTTSTKLSRKDLRGSQDGSLFLCVPTYGEVFGRRGLE